MSLHSAWLVARMSLPIERHQQVIPTRTGTNPPCLLVTTHLSALSTCSSGLPTPTSSPPAQPFPHTSPAPGKSCHPHPGDTSHALSRLCHHHLWLSRRAGGASSPPPLPHSAPTQKSTGRAPPSVLLAIYSSHMCRTSPLLRGSTVHI